MDAELTLYKKDEITGAYSTPDYSYFVDNKNDFELIEEDTIDIDSIEELDINYKECVDLGNNTIFDYHNNTRTAINELIQAVKQLNKEIKSIKEK